MSHVFVSYSKKNRDYARRLADYLLASGFDVWIDDRIDFGSNWEREIFAAIDACAAIIVIMTPESYDSLWVQRERQYAEHRRKPPFPLLLAGEPFPFYVVIQHYDVRSGELPGASFLDQLGEVAPQRTTAGHNVAVAPQQQARLKFETSEAEAATAQPVPAATPPAAVRRGRRTWIVPAVALLAVALAGALLVTLNGGAPAALAPGPTPLGGGRGEIAFVSDRDGNMDIFLIDALGELRKLTSDPAEDIEPSWSPDGSRIVFTSYRDDGNARLYIMEADGSGVSRLLAEQGGWEPAWSPAGDRIAFTSYGDNSQEIFVVNTDGTGLRALTDNDYIDGYAAWSPDGAQIVYVSEPHGHQDLYIMDVDGGETRALTQDSDSVTTPAWSPDGTLIGFEFSPEGYPQICTVDVEGGNLRCAPGDAGDAYEPAWSPDGAQIAFTSYRDSNFGREIYLMDLAGLTTTRITYDSAEDLTPAWRP